MTFQTIHVHCFSWLSAVGRNEVMQVMAARIVMSVFFLGTSLCLLLLGTYLLDTPGALFALSCYIFPSYTLHNGASFRSDTPAAFFAMFALYLFLTREKSWFANILAGMSMALACMFTIKAALYLALFVPLSFIRLWGSRRSRVSLTRTGAFGMAFAVGLFVTYVLHAATLAASAPQPPNAFLGRAAYTFLTLGHLFPGLRFFLGTLVFDPVIWLLLAIGLFVFLGKLCGKRKRPSVSSAYLGMMFMPLLSLLIYRNAYPYYYVFMMPPVTLFCGYGLRSLLRAVKPQRQWLSAATTSFLAILILQNLGWRYPFLTVEAPQTTAVQRNLLEEIHKMFPMPVPYIDGCRMVASYPNAGFFMSTAGMKRYLRGGHASMKRLLTEEQPLFVLTNVPHLDLNCDDPPVSSAGLTFRDDDWVTLRAHFIHHWGPVWVTGKQFEAGSENLNEDFEIIAPGAYTLEANTDVLIDGRRFQPGETVWLSLETHTIKVAEPAGTIRLRWGNHLYCPEQEPASDRLFLGIFG